MALNGIIDMHTHMFNGFYVPIEDILSRRFGFQEDVARTMGYLMKKAIRKEGPPSWKEETSWRKLAEDPDRTDLLAEVVLDRIKGRLNTELQDLTLPGVLERQSRSHLFDEITRIASARAGEDKAAFSAAKFGEDLAALLIRRESLSEETTRLVNLSSILDRFLLAALKDSFKALEGYADFFGKMLQHDRSLCAELLGDNYSEDNRPALTIHLMMDIDPAFRGESGRFTGAEYDFHEKQIPRASDMVAASEGRLLGFVAFDPRRGDPGLLKCRAALERGNIGIKIYPPLGYRPDDFVKHPSLSTLYDYCKDHDIPILAHCTPVGFEAEKGAGVNADPDYWENVLEQFPTLRLCLGHAGGGHFKDIELPGRDGPVDLKGWYCTESAKDQTEWSEYGYPGKIIDLCVTYKNVYTDFSYLHTMIFSPKGERETFKKRLGEALSRKPVDYAFGTKIIYGTDWHMARIVNSTNAYLEMFKEIFDEKDLEPFREGFFFRNAIRYLRLEAYVEKERNKPVPFLSEKALQHIEELLAL